MLVLPQFSHLKSGLISQGMNRWTQQHSRPRTSIHFIVMFWAKQKNIILRACKWRESKCTALSQDSWPMLQTLQKGHCWAPCPGHLLLNMFVLVPRMTHNNCVTPWHRPSFCIRVNAHLCHKHRINLHIANPLYVTTHLCVHQFFSRGHNQR